VAAWAVAWLLQRSTLGFELRAVGSNPEAARTAGMSITKTYVLVMMISGGLAGLGGASMLLGPAQSLTPAVIGGVGFDGITVALLGRGTPYGTLLAGLLFGGLRAGAVRMQVEAHIPVDMVTILQAMIVIFIAAPALVKAIFRLREQRVAGLGQALAKGW
jgi:simple sugar transport system permease protein